jgi:hypothetical protein
LPRDDYLFGRIAFGVILGIDAVERPRESCENAVKMPIKDRDKSVKRL